MMRFIFLAATTLFFSSIALADKPNIVFVMCDDLGYGDIHCLAPDTCKIDTPGADQLAKEGMIFTDAHSGSSVCTPTRYGLMTGRYSWRTRLQKGVVTGFAPSLIAEDRPTVASFLKSQGYDTAVIGKWHLNFDYLDPKTAAVLTQKQHKTPPVGATIPDGPVHRGFDYFHGFHHARNMDAVIENDRVIQHDDEINMLPRLTEKSIQYIRSRKGNPKPFYLYIPLGSPHTPIVPSPAWQGKSKLGKYGDFVMQTDNVVVEIINALKENHFDQNTLFVFTSDNGCSKAAGISQLAQQGHLVSAHLRGSKADLWDGGHRVPFIVRWPGKVAPGSTSDQLICLVDWFATAADVVKHDVPPGSCEDSVSFLPALLGEPIQSTRHGVIHHSFSGHFAYRTGNWKLLLAKGSGGWSSPKENQVADDAPKAQLYDLGEDVGEQNNLFTSKPQVVQELLDQLRDDINRGRSTDGPEAANDTDDIVLWKSEDKSSKPKARKNKNNKKSSDASADDKRPNVLFILTDDQAPYSLGAYGNQVCQTPNLDQLAARGMRIDQAYHMGANKGAVCTPSRHMIMSGRTLWHLPTASRRSTVLESMGKPVNESDKVNHVPDNLASNTIGAVFNRAGYETMRTCKRGNSYPQANAQFTTVADKSNRGGKEGNSSWHADQVLDFFKKREAGASEKPFMVYFGFSHPHDPRYGDEPLLAKYAAVNRLPEDAEVNPSAPALPINYLPKHPFNHGHMNLRDEVSVQGVGTRRDEATIRNEKGREYACIENIDRQIGRVLEHLKNNGQLDNTYVIFTSDHGIAIGRHGLMGKQSLYEHSWRVPYLVAGPGIAPGSSATGNIYLLDTLATICDLAGIDPPDTNEGKSFKSVLMGQQDKVRDVLYGAYCGGQRPGIRCVRKGDWKLIRYENSDGAVKVTQLFNLRENPFELLPQHHDPAVIALTGNTPKANQTNLADAKEYAEKRTEMEALLLSEMQRLNDPYRFDEGYVNRKSSNQPKRAKRAKKKK